MGCLTPYLDLSLPSSSEAEQGTDDKHQTELTKGRNHRVLWSLWNSSGSVFQGRNCTASVCETVYNAFLGGVGRRMF